MLASYADLLTALCRFGGGALMLFSVILGAGIVLYYRAEAHRLRHRPYARGDLYARTVVDLIWPIVFGTVGLSLFYYSF